MTLNDSKNAIKYLMIAISIQISMRIAHSIIVVEKFISKIYIYGNTEGIPYFNIYLSINFAISDIIPISAYIIYLKKDLSYLQMVMSDEHYDRNEMNPSICTASIIEDKLLNDIIHTQINKENTSNNLHEILNGR